MIVFLNIERVKKKLKRNVKGAKLRANFYFEPLQILQIVYEKSKNTINPKKILTKLMNQNPEFKFTIKLQ